MAGGRSTGIATGALGQAGTGHALPMPHFPSFRGTRFSPRPRAEIIFEILDKVRSAAKFDVGGSSGASANGGGSRI